MCVCACVRACVRAWVSEWVRACVRACVSVCVWEREREKEGERERERDELSNFKSGACCTAELGNLKSHTHGTKPDNFTSGIHDSWSGQLSSRYAWQQNLTILLHTPMTAEPDNVKPGTHDSWIRQLKTRHPWQLNLATQNLAVRFRQLYFRYS